MPQYAAKPLMPRIVARVSFGCVDGCCVAEVTISSSLTTLRKIERRASLKYCSIVQWFCALLQRQGG